MEMTRPLCTCPASKWPHVHVQRSTEPDDAAERILGRPIYAETRKQDEREIMRIANRRDDE